MIPSALFSITLLHHVSVTTAIKCFTCNEEENISCPGWDRSGYQIFLIHILYFISTGDDDIFDQLGHWWTAAVTHT